ncbi:MAG: hypothetical protein RLZZ528_218 [Pseudomonadota bacterium]
MSSRAATSVASSALSSAPVTQFQYRDVLEGIAARHVRAILAEGLVHREDIRRVIPDRTLERRISANEKLTTTEADGIARLARTVGQARATFGDPGIADEWLRSPNPALDGNIPIEMAATDIGAREVEIVLGRIAHGVYS